MSTRRKQFKPKAFKDGETNTDGSCNSKESSREGSKEKRIKMEASERNDSESECTDSRPPSGSLAASQGSLKSVDASIPCIFCEKTFTDAPALQNHTVSEHMNAGSSSPDGPSFVCQQCDATLPSFVAFGQHMRTHLAGEQEQKCYLCNITFTNPQRRVAHVVEHFTGNSSRIVCKECPSVTFFNAQQIRQHHAEAHLEILYRCSICQRIFNTQNRFQEHCGTHNSEVVRYHCTACNAPFETHDLLTIHVQLVHERQLSQACALVAPLPADQHILLADLPQASPHVLQSEAHSVKCSVCDIGFENDDELDLHRLNIHCKVPHSDRCAECQMEIDSVAQFVEHIRLHMHSVQNVTCVVCRQALRNDAQIETHANFHMKNACEAIKPSIVAVSDSENEHRCNICYQVLATEELLRVHVVEHSSSGECPYCSKSFVQPQALVKHISANHGDARPAFACHACEQPFHFLSELQHHKCLSLPHIATAIAFTPERILSSLRDGYSSLLQQQTPPLQAPTYQCPFCPKMFASESALQGHSHVHSSRAYRCDLCTLSFSSTARLETHRKKHFSEKDFTCQICDLKFHSREDLAVHMRVHGGNLANGKAIASTNA